MPPSSFRWRWRPVFLAAVVAWACAGSAVWQGARMAHYRWMRTVTSLGNRDTILVTAGSNAVWMEKDEVRYEGRMFDVQARREVAGGWVLIGHYDESDDKLFGVLHQLFGNDSRDSAAGKRICIFLPEAVLLSNVPAASRWAFSPPPVDNPSPEERWHDACPDQPDIPPEAAA